MAKRRRLIPNPQFALSEEDGLDPIGRAPMAPPPIARVAAEASAQAALDELAGVMAQAKAEGRLVLRLPLARIDLNHLVRDRLSLDEDELQSLTASIREHGQRLPIEVSDLGEGRYGLISGWRRMQALSRLSAEDPRFGEVQALLRRPTDASQAYIAMVEENEIRQGLSYYERARIAARAVDLGVFPSEKQALQQLFAAASRARRSKIGSFLSLYRALDAVLSFPAAIPERLGLALVKHIEEQPEAIGSLRDLLAALEPDTAEEELAALTQAIAPARGADAEAPPKSKSQRQEVSPGIFLDISGGFSKPVLTLSGPAVDPVFRERLEIWLREGR